MAATNNDDHESLQLGIYIYAGDRERESNGEDERKVWHAMFVPEKEGWEQ